MLRRTQLSVSLLACAAVAAGRNLPPARNQVKDLERQIFARARLFPEIGPGVSELKRDTAGRYFVLAGSANSIFVYGADGKRSGQIPASSQAGAQIVFAQDFDLDPSGRIIVADRGGNALKVFASDGSLLASIPVATPTSVVALSGGEVAVTSFSSKRLVSVFDANGSLVRSFGDPIGAEEGDGVHSLTNRGRISGDAAGHIYFAFTNLADPTIREYDRFGYGSYVLALTAAEFGASPHDQRKDIFGIERSNNTRSASAVIGAVGVDAATQHVWVAIGSSLVHFDRDGTRLLTYHTVTRQGLRIEATAILIEPDRILLADDPIGIFDFARPDKQQPGTP